LKFVPKHLNTHTRARAHAHTRARAHTHTYTHTHTHSVFSNKQKIYDLKFFIIFYFFISKDIAAMFDYSEIHNPY